MNGKIKKDTIKTLRSQTLQNTSFMFVAFQVFCSKFKGKFDL